MHDFQAQRPARTITKGPKKFPYDRALQRILKTTSALASLDYRGLVGGLAVYHALYGEEMTHSRSVAPPSSRAGTPPRGLSLRDYLRSSPVEDGVLATATPEKEQERRCSYV